MGDIHCSKLSAAAAAIVIGFSTPKIASAAESPKFFDYLHGGKFVAELACKYWYGEGKPAEDEKRVGKKVCHVVLHPVGVLRDHEPDWWKTHEPKVLRGVEELIQEFGDARETPVLNCRLHASGCWSGSDYSIPNYGLLTGDPAARWPYLYTDKPSTGLPSSTNAIPFGLRSLRDVTGTRSDVLTDGTTTGRLPSYGLPEFVNKPNLKSNESAKLPIQER